MPRLVVPKDITKGKLESRTIDVVPADDYKDRLVKYIPAESVAFYALVDKLVASHYNLEGSTHATPVPAAYASEQACATEHSSGHKLTKIP